MSRHGGQENTALPKVLLSRYRKLSRVPRPLTLVTPCDSLTALIHPESWQRLLSRGSGLRYHAKVTDGGGIGYADDSTTMERLGERPWLMK